MIQILKKSFENSLEILQIVGILKKSCKIFNNLAKSRKSLKIPRILKVSKIQESEKALEISKKSLKVLEKISKSLKNLWDFKMPKSRTLFFEWFAPRCPLIYNFLFSQASSTANWFLAISIILVLYLKMCEILEFDELSAFQVYYETLPCFKERKWNEMSAIKSCKLMHSKILNLPHS